VPPPPPLDCRLSTGQGDLTAERAASPCDVRPACSIKPAPTIALSVSGDCAGGGAFVCSSDRVVAEISRVPSAVESSSSDRCVA